MQLILSSVNTFYALYNPSGPLQTEQSMTAVKSNPALFLRTLSHRRQFVPIFSEVLKATVQVGYNHYRIVIFLIL